MDREEKIEDKIKKFRQTIRNAIGDLRYLPPNNIEITARNPELLETLLTKINNCLDPENVFQIEIKYKQAIAGWTNYGLKINPKENAKINLEDYEKKRAYFVRTWNHIAKDLIREKTRKP